MASQGWHRLQHLGKKHGKTWNFSIWNSLAFPFVLMFSWYKIRYLSISFGATKCIFLDGFFQQNSRLARAQVAPEVWEANYSIWMLRPFI